MMVGPAPCKGCVSRTRNCHAGCRDYHDWKKRWDEHKDAVYRKKHDIENFMAVTKGRGLYR